MADKFVAWVTKSALSGRIVKVTGELLCEGSLLRYLNGNGSHEYAYREGKEWHRTEALAVQHAEAMKQKRIDSLRKSITKMEKLAIKVVDHG